MGQRTARGRSRACLVGVVLSVAVVAGCAEERSPIDRVQANVIRKADLSGTWYYLQTVVDSPYSAAFTTVGEQSYLDKIEWEIQERYLIARRSYEWIAGSEPEGVDGPGSERGAVVAMYSIESHFDIRREYNSTTGEEVNVLVENDEDRLWWEREYMRVDWSVNHIPDADALAWARVLDGVEVRPVATFEQEPDDPLAPVFEHDEETGELRYFDVVNRVYVEPTTVWDEWWGEIPTCWLADSLYLDCVGAEIALRSSFLRVDESRDYQPWDYSGDRMARFGYFVNERAGLDPEYGVVDPARYRFINRHDIWQASHRRDGAGELLPCTSDEECDDGMGSVCDLDLAKARRTEQGACTIPYRERAVKPMAYHLSANFPEELVVDVEHVVADWNGIFVETVGSLRALECERTGGSAEGCEAERRREDGATVLVLCHDPVGAEDHEACGAEGTRARLGDLRYNIFGWVSDAHVYAPLGYGPSAVDPETGEVVNASVLVYGPDLEELAAYGRDLLALLNGDLSQEDVATGENVRRVAERLGREASGRDRRPGEAHAVDVDGSDMDRIARAMDFSWLREPRAGQRVIPRDRPSGLREGLERRAAARANVARRGGFGRGDGAGYALLDGLRGSPLEALMTTPELRLAAGLDPTAAPGEEALEAASPLRGLSLQGRRARRDAQRRLRGNRCWMQAEFQDDGLLGLALEIRRAVESGDGTVEWYGQRYRVRGDDGAIDYDLVRQMIRHPVLESTMSHELGHTLGLRHNFMGSYDALNYHQRYWELRDDGDMRPRAWDPLSEEEIDGRIREYQTSSMMDYGNNYISTDAIGVGRYDRAAIKMGYGDLVEVFTDAPDAHEVAWVNFMQLWEYSVTLREDSFYVGYPVTAYEYTELPAVVGGIEALDHRADVPFTELVPDPDLESEGITELLLDGQGRPAVPYRFCSDEVSDLDPTCMAYDAGADAYETTQSIIDSYWYYYAFNAFRRERLGFEIDPYYWRILERYLWKLQWANQAYALYRVDFSEMFGDDAEPFFTRPDGFGAWTLAAGAAYELLTRIVTVPEPGGYNLYELGDGTDAWLYDEYYEPELEVDEFEGRTLSTTWDWDQGYYWFDAIDRVGFFYDKILALQVLVDPETSFVGQDEASDVRSYALSFYTTFGSSLTGFLGGLLASDWANVAPRPTPEGALLYPDPLELETGDMAGTPVDPNAGFTMQLYAAAFGMAMIPQTYSQAFSNEARIWVQGGAEGVDVEPAEYRVELYEPVSGMTYVAASYPDEDGRETGAGARMLLHAQALADREEWSELAYYMDTIDVVRALSWDYGFATY